MRDSLWSLNHGPLFGLTLELLLGSLLRRRVYLIKKLFKFGFTLAIQEYRRFVVGDVLFAHEGSLVKIDLSIFGRHTKFTSF